MSTAELARDLVIAAAMPRGAFDNRKSMLARAATRLGIGYRRTKAFFYGEARLIGADEWQRLQRRADELGIKAAWNEAQHARMAMDLRERTPLRVGGAASDGPGSAASGEARRGAGAGAVAGSTEGG